jgi:hypothetical protein
MVLHDSKAMVELRESIHGEVIAFELLGEKFTALEVLGGDDQVCGVEITCIKATDSCTIETEPITTDESKSWSISSADNSFQDDDHVQPFSTGPHLPSTCKVEDHSEGIHWQSPIYTIIKNKPKKRANNKRRIFSRKVAIHTGGVTMVPEICESDSINDDYEQPLTMERQPLQRAPQNRLDHHVDPYDYFDDNVSCTPSLIDGCSSDDDEETIPLRVLNETAIESSSSIITKEYVSELRSIINVLEPMPNTRFTDLVAQCHWMLCQVTLQRSNLGFVLSRTESPSFVEPPVILYRNDASPTVVVATDLGARGFELSSCRQLTHGTENLTLESDPWGDYVSMADLSMTNDKTMAIVRGFHLAKEAAEMKKTSLYGWSSGFLAEPEEEIVFFEVNCKSIDDIVWVHDDHAKDDISSTSELKDRTAHVPTGPIDDDVSDLTGCQEKTVLRLRAGDRLYEEGPVLFNDKELPQQLLEQTEGESDVTDLLFAFSEDTIKTIESDDGLRQEINDLDSAEDSLRMELASCDLVIKSVYMRTVKMKDEPDDRLPVGDVDALPWNIPRQRKVRFSSQNQEFLFHSEPQSGSLRSADRTSSFLGFLGAKWEDMFTVIEEFHDDLQFSCTKIYEQRTQYFRPTIYSPPPCRKLQMSTVHFL